MRGRPRGVTDPKRATKTINDRAAMGREGAAVHRPPAEWWPVGQQTPVERLISDADGGIRLIGGSSPVRVPAASLAARWLKLDGVGTDLILCHADTGDPCDPFEYLLTLRGGGVTACSPPRGWVLEFKSFTAYRESVNQQIEAARRSARQALAYHERFAREPDSPHFRRVASAMLSAERAGCLDYFRSCVNARTIEPLADG